MSNADATKCPDGRSLSAHEKGLCDCRNKPTRSALVHAMHMVHGHPKSRIIMGDRRMKRSKDAKKSWKREEY